jgi:FkbM family methyltransferase
MQIETCGHVLTIPDEHAADFASEAAIRDRFWHIRPDDVVLDIGASVGIYTLPALAMGAYVFAIDVLNDPHASPLARMAQENGLAEKLLIIQCAVGENNGFDSPDMRCGYSAEMMDAVRTYPAVYPGLTDCSWSTVDNLVRGYCIEHVDWIKVDTEGGELPVLRGAAATLGRDHPRLLVEEHSHLEHIRAMGSADKLRAELDRHGYAREEVPYEERFLWFCQ